MKMPLKIYKKKKKPSHQYDKKTTIRSEKKNWGDLTNLRYFGIFFTLFYKIKLDIGGLK